ncbi:MAG: hypothetical protein QNJ97_14180 [Myxococcota bacterium]|nr:hypothetical protein [Myxococcota bacterium]
MNPILKRFFIIFSMCGMLAGVGCDSEDGTTYDVTVAWQIGGLPACESSTLPDALGGGRLQFDEIQVRVYENETDPEPIRDVRVSCADYSYTINNLDSGTYFVTLDAFAQHQGVYLPYFQSSGSIDAVASDGETVDFQLLLGTGTIVVSWGFEQGVCGTNGVTKLNVTLSGSAVNDVSFSNIQCDDGMLTIEEVKWNSYRLNLEGYNAANELTHTGQSEQFLVRPGAVIDDDDGAYVVLVENQTP